MKSSMLIFQSSGTATKSDGSPKGRKMSFKEKFRRFTSPTTNRKGNGETTQPQPPQEGFTQPLAEASCEVPTSKKTIREKLACALSPESLRKKSLSSAEGSPQKKKKVAGNSNFEIENREASPKPQGQGQGQTVEPTCLMPLSPSINFIDAVPSEEVPPPKAQDDIVPGKKRL